MMLDGEDMFEIARHIMIKKVHVIENVIQFGDIGDNFYIILKGVVAVEVPNPLIKDRDMKAKDFEMLKRWK